MLGHFEKIPLHHCQPWDFDYSHWIFEVNWHWHTFPHLSFFIFLNFFQKSCKCCKQRSITRLDKDFLRHCGLYGFMPPTSPRAPRVCLGSNSRFPQVNFPTHGEIPTNRRENDEKRRKATNRQKTAALVVARFATNLVDAQGAEAAVVHEPIEVLRIFQVVKTVKPLMRDDLIRFISKEQQKWNKSEVNKNLGCE